MLTENKFKNNENEKLLVLNVFMSRNIVLLVQILMAQISTLYLKGILKMKISKYSNIVFLSIIGCLCFNLSGCASISSLFDDTDTRVEDNINFVPETGNSYNIEWSGPPREPLNYDQVKFYIPQIELVIPATRNYLQRYKIKVDRWFGDKQIGEFEALYDAGQTEPRIIRYASFLQLSEPPSNAPVETKGKFWLGCTKRGKVKGNIGKHSNSVVIYLEEDDIRLSSDLVLRGRKSPKRTIKCIDFGEGISRQACTTNSGCGEGRLCIGGICKQLLQGRSCRTNDDCTDVATEGPCVAIRNGDIIGDCEDYVSGKKYDPINLDTSPQCRCVLR